MELPLSHFISGLDEDPACCSANLPDESTISGYTEWLSVCVPIITVGWDWRLIVLSGRPRYVRDSLPRSNVMIIDAETGLDFGDTITTEIIAHRLDRSHWEEDVLAHIVDRYAGHVFGS
ncbi:uncharacterized protein DUF4902 [Halothiobacillus neapolitanus]|nr:uncharacterized protein DUF4902 [Halothiobacillus neapolitanus]